MPTHHPVLGVDLSNPEPLAWVRTQLARGLPVSSMSGPTLYSRYGAHNAVAASICVLVNLDGVPFHSAVAARIADHDPVPILRSIIPLTPEATDAHARLIHYYLTKELR